MITKPGGQNGYMNMCSKWGVNNAYNKHAWSSEMLQIIGNISKKALGNIRVEFVDRFDCLCSSSSKILFKVVLNHGVTFNVQYKIYDPSRSFCTTY